MKNTVTIVTDANEFQACMAVRAAAFLSRGEPYSDEYDGNDLICATHLLARQNDTPVGTMRIRIVSAAEGGVAVWERLAVTPVAHRGIGVLNSLADKAMAYTQFKGCHRIIGGVADPRLQRFWKKRGFTMLNKPPVKYNETDYIQMGMDMSPVCLRADLKAASLAEAGRFEESLQEGTVTSTPQIISCA